ncbi:MAG: hypothetical protein NTU43_03095 [Bacteroidetes bacterium]|nr:hypothetical protein [Bacteroidota bacterium]
MRSGIDSLLIPYSNGIINGNVIYYIVGGTRSEMHYVNNVANGLCKDYNNGVFVGEANWIDGESTLIEVEKKDNNLAAALQGIQQAAAYNNMMTNTNSQTVNEYTQVAANNYTKPGSVEAVNANSKVLENANSVTNSNNVTNSQIQSESSASTNGGSFNKNAGAAKKCADETTARWKQSSAYINFDHNQGCSKLALLSQKECAVMLLNSCREYLPPADITVFEKTISSLTSQINSTPDCKTY